MDLQQPHQFRQHMGFPLGLVFSPNGESLLSATYGGIVRSWNLNTNEERIVTKHSNLAHSLSFSADGRRVVSCSNAIHVTEFPSYETHILPTSDRPFYRRCRFSPDGAHLASAHNDGGVRYWDLNAGTNALIRSHEGAARSIAFSPDSHFLASGGDDNMVSVTNLLDATSRLLRGHTATVWEVVFSADGKLLASAGADNTIRVWDIPARTSQVLRGHEGAVVQLQFTWTGKGLISAGRDGTLRLWNVRTGEAETLRGHVGGVIHTVSHGDRLLASAGEDGTVRLWDMQRGAVRIFRGHLSSVYGIAFSPDGTLLASGGKDGNIFIWQTSSPANLPDSPKEFQAWLNAMSSATLEPYEGW